MSRQNLATVLVTGGGKGVGRAISREFAKNGAHVIINYFHSADAAESTLDEISQLGGSAELLRGSIANPESVQFMFDTIARRHERLDVLVNNAARGVLAAADTITDREWCKVFDVNVHGARRCCWAALPLLRPNKGAIVNVSSIGAGMVMDNYITVGVSKAALEALTRYLAVEFAKYGVRVNAASAGLLDNPTADLFPHAEDLKETCATGAPLGRLGTEVELARLVTFLASREASWVTGQTLLADGGLGLGHAMLRANPPAAPDLSADKVVISPSPKKRLDSVEPQPADVDTVAVVGMGIAVPGAYSPEEFWELLSGGTDIFTGPGDRFRYLAFHNKDFNAQDRAYTCQGGYLDHTRLHPSTASAGTDLSVQALRHSIMQAYNSVVKHSRTRVGVWSGMSVDHNQSFEESLVVETATRYVTENWPSATPHETDLADRVREALLSHYPNASAQLGAYLPTSVLDAATKGLVPEGTPQIAVDAACSSSLYAVDLAVKSLLAGEIDTALCCGVVALSPRYFVEFCKLRGLSASGHVQSLGKDADGTLCTDAAVAITLKPLRQARRDGDSVLAVLGGFGGASDGRGKAVYAPNTTGQNRAVARARSVDGLDSSDIDWIVAHATGTPAGDRVEIETITANAPENGLLCTSNKAVIGHPGWAAGLVSVIHAILGLQHDTVLAQAPFGEAAPALGSGRVRVPREHTPLPVNPVRPRAVGISSFGFGGINAHLIVRDEPADGSVVRSSPSRTNEDIVLVGWSAYLPGFPSRATVSERIAAGKSPSDQSAFPTPFPGLPKGAARLAPHTVQTMDRTQLMALAVVHQFAEENGDLWHGISEKTGVITAHYGPTAVLPDVTLRCYIDDLLSFVPRLEHQIDAVAFKQAVADAVADLKRRRIPTNEDTMPGHMPNVIPARITNHLDLHGPSITIDSGRTSTTTAIHCAIHYLTTGELDLGLVLAITGSSTRDTAATMNESVERLREGAFLFALARESDARQHNWPILANISAATRPATHRNTEPKTYSYLGADTAINVLEAIATNSERTLPGTLKTITIIPRGGSSKAVVTTPYVTARHVPNWEPQPLPSHLPGRAAPRSGMVVFADRANADELRNAAIAGPAVAVIDVDDKTDPVKMVEQLPAEYDHVRVIVPRTQDWAWPDAPRERILRLQEVLFLAVQRNHHRIRDHGSIGVALLDDFQRDAPVPHSGLFTGFIKSISWEFPDCCSRAVITDTDSTTAWGMLDAELIRPKGFPVTLYRNGIRYRQRLVQESGDHSPTLSLEPGSVVVAVGGARGITAAVVERLAREVPLSIWLIGSSRLDDVPAELVEVDDADLDKLRVAFIARGLANEPAPSVAELNKQFDRKTRAREATLTLRRLRRQCGEENVHYLTADVTAADAVRSAANAVAAHHDRIDLMINGAGIHHPGDIERKTLDGFRTVRDVKLYGYHNLKNSFSATTWVNFGSVTGVVGLPGETEYSPSNDYLSHAATYENATREHDELTIAWTVWDEVGLGSSKIAQSMIKRTTRLSSMPKNEGVQHFAEELSRRNGKPPVVTFIGVRERDAIGALFPGYLNEAQIPAGATQGTYLHQPNAYDEKSATWHIVINPSDHSYLEEHTVDGKPTVPGTVLCNIAAEAARFLDPSKPVRALCDLSFQAWVRVRDKPYTVTATRQSPNSKTDSETVVRITSAIIAPNGDVLNEREHFRATVVNGLQQVLRAQPITAGTPTLDPYYEAGSRVLLSGIFRATRDSRWGPLGTTARWSPITPLPDVFRSLIVPSLLLDSLARAVALQPNPDGTHSVVAPRYIRRIELFTTSNDHELAQEHPDGLHLQWESRNDRWSAISERGVVIACVEGMRTTPLN